jgi:Armadillo/beta-catenin-like repeat
MLTLLISLSNAPDPEVRQYAAYALVKVGQNSDVRKQVTDEGGLEPVLYLARTDEPEIQRETLACLCSLSFAEENKVNITKYGGLPAIAGAIRSPHADTARMAACACANLCEVVENMDRVVDAGVIPLLVLALGSGESQVAREAARAIGNLCANLEYGDTVLRAGALPHLMALVRSEDQAVQRMAAMALCNLSSNVRNQPKLLKSGILEPVIAETRAALDPKSRSDHETIRYCLLILANLSVTSENHTAVMSQCLDTLAGYSKHRDIKARQHAVFALGNLCANVDNVEAIVKSGALKTLITYAFPSTDTSTNVQFQAVAALRGIATHPSLRMQIVREGGLEPLALAAKSTSIEVQRETAATLANLALAEENKVAMARSGVLPALVALCDSGDRERIIHAISAMANIAEMVEGRTHSRMIEEGCLRPLLRLALDETEIRQEAARCLALFASKRDTQQHLLRAGAVPRMVTFVRGITASMASANTATATGTAAAITGGTAASTALTLHNTDSSNSNSNNSGSLTTVSTAKATVADPIVMRYGVLGLGNMAVSSANHTALFESGAVTCLLSKEVYESSDLETRRCCAFALNNIASHEPNHRACEKMGVLRPLCHLLKDSDQDTHLQAAFAVRQLSISARCRAQFLELKGLTSLLALGSKSESVEVLREVAAALRNVSLSEHSKVDIVREGGLTVLATMMHSADVETAHQSTGVIANLAEAVENQGTMVESGILQHLKFVMRSMSVDVQREAVRGIANISAEYAYTAAIASAGAIVPLVSMLSSPDFLCQRYAAMGCGNLATNLANQERLMHEGAMQPLLSLAKRDNGDLESQRFAVFALTNVAATRANHAQLARAGVVALVCELLQADDVELRDCAAFCVANFASNPDCHAMLSQQDVLPALIRLAGCDDVRAQLRATSALRGLSVDEQLRVDIVTRGGLTPLLKLTRSNDVELQLEVLAALCNLSLSGCVGANPLAFLNAVDAQSLVSFLCSADVTYRLFGAVTLGNIAAHDQLRTPLAAAGAIAPLVAVADSADLETQRCIAYALCNLCADASRRSSVVNEGGLPPIISLACSDDSTDQLAAVSALRAIAADAHTRRAVVQHGALEALCITAQCSDDVCVQRETARTLYALTLNDLNKLDVACLTRKATTAAAAAVAPVHDVLPYIVQLAQSSDLVSATHAIGALANLSENESIHDRLLSSQWGSNSFLTAPLLPLYTSTTDTFAADDTGDVQQQQQQWCDDVALGREAARCLANLATNWSTHDALLLADAAAALTRAGTRNDVITTRFAALGLMNLASKPTATTNTTDSTTDSTIVSMQQALNSAHAAVPLAKLAAGCSVAYVQLNDDGVIDDTTSIATITDTSSSDRELTVDGEQYAKLGYDVQTRRYACLAVGQLACDKLHHTALIDSGAITALAQALLVDDSETVFNAAYACNRFTTTADSSDDTSTVAAGAQLIPQLIELVAITDDANTLGQAVAALRHIAAQCSDSAVAIVQCGILQAIEQGGLAAICRDAGTGVTVSGKFTPEIAVTSALKNSGISTSLEIAREAAALYNALSVPFECKRPIALSCETIGTSTATTTVAVAAAAVAAASLMCLCQSSDVEVSRMATGAMANLSEDVIGTHTSLLLHANAMHYLLHLMRSRHLAVHREAARAVANLLSSQVAREQWIHEDGLRSLAPIAKSTDAECQYSATLILRKLCAGAASSAQTYLVGGGGLKLLLLLLQRNDVDTRRQAAAALLDIACCAEHRVTVAAEGGLQGLITAARCSNDVQLRLLSIGAIRHLSLAAKVKRVAVEDGVLGPLLCALDDVIAHCSKHGNTTSATTTAVATATAVTATSHSVMTATECADTIAQCCGTLANLADDVRNQVTLVTDGALSRLAALTAIGDESVRCDIARAYGSITSNAECQVGCFTATDIDALLSLVVRPFEELCTRDALMALGNLAVVNKNQALIAARGGLTCIIAVLTSSYVSCRRYAARAMSRLCALGDNQPLALQAGALLPLVKLLKRSIKTTTTTTAAAAVATDSSSTSLVTSSDDETAMWDPETGRFAAMTVCNLSSHPDCRQLMAQNGGLAPLVELLSIRSTDGITAASAAGSEHLELSQRYAAMALCNLATLPENQLHVVKQGGLAPLVALASLQQHDSSSTTATSATSSSSSTTKRNELSLYAAMALSNVACHRQNRTAVVEAGALVPLCMLALGTTATATATTAVAATAAATTAQSANKKSSSKQDKASKDKKTAAASTAAATVSNAAALASIADNSSGRIEVQRAAGLTLYNLSCNATNLVAMAQQGCTAALVALTKCTDIDCRRFAVMTLCNLAAKSETRAAATKGGGLQSAIRLTRSAGDSDTDCMSYAAIAVCNMAAETQTQAAVAVHGGLIPILDMAANSETTTTNSNTSSIDNARYAVMALGNLAANESNHAQLVSKGVMAVLKRLAASSEPDIREYAGFALANLASNADYTDVIGAQGGISPLVTLANSSSVNAQCLGLAALRRLAAAPENGQKLIDGGAMSALARAGRSSYVEVQRETAACLCNLSLGAAQRLSLARSCVPSLVRLAQGGDSEAARQAIGALANLAEDCDTHAVIAAAGGARALVVLMSLSRHDSDVKKRMSAVTAATATVPTATDDTDDDTATTAIAAGSAGTSSDTAIVDVPVSKSLTAMRDLYREASRAVCNLLTSLEHQASVVQDGLDGLIALAYTTDTECQYHAALSLRKLTPNLASHSGICSKGGLPALIKLLAVRDLKTRLQAATALRDLSAHPDHKLLFAQEGGLVAAVALGLEREVELQVLAVAMVRHLALHPDLKRECVQAGALRPVVRCVRWANEDLQCQCAGVMANLSEDQLNQVTNKYYVCLSIACSKYYKLSAAPRLSSSHVQRDAGAFSRALLRCAAQS